MAGSFSRDPDGEDAIVARLMEIVGSDATWRIIQEFGGTQIYIPAAGTIVRRSRDRRIRAQFTGANLTQLARQHGLTPRRVREILKGVER